MQTEIGKQTQIWEKSAKRRLLAVMAVIIAAILGFAGWKEYTITFPKRINDLERLEDITDGLFSVSFAYYDGNSGMFWQSSSADDEMEKARELLEKLSKAKGKRMANAKWDIGKISYPMYSVCVTPKIQTDLKPVYVLWSNGLLYLGDNRVYKCDVDFTDFIEAKDVMTNCFPLESIEGNGMFRGFSMVRTWIPRMLKPSNFKGQPALTNLSFDYCFTTFDRKINGTVLAAGLINSTDVDVRFSKTVFLEVQIDYSWYQVPRDPRYGFESSVARVDSCLEAGESASVDFDISRYGSLPTGKYRLVVPVRLEDKNGVMYIEFDD